VPTARRSVVATPHTHERPERDAPSWTEDVDPGVRRGSCMRSYPLTSHRRTPVPTARRSVVATPHTHERPERDAPSWTEDVDPGVRRGDGFMHGVAAP